MPPRSQQRQRLAASATRCAAKPFAGQREQQRVGNGDFVFDDEYLRHGDQYATGTPLYASTLTGNCRMQSHTTRIARQSSSL